MNLVMPLATTWTHLREMTSKQPRMTKRDQDTTLVTALDTIPSVLVAMSTGIREGVWLAWSVYTKAIGSHNLF